MQPPPGVPHYVHLARILEQRIRDGRIPVQVPSKRELVAEFKVAPATVDKAMRRLKERGLTATTKGLGVFVRPREEWPPEQGQ